MTTFSWSYLALKTVGNTRGLSLILLWHFYLGIKFSDTATWKSQKPLIKKKHVKWKTFGWYVKNYNILSIFTLFQLLLQSLFAVLKMALWFHFPQNSPYKLFNSERPEDLNEIYLPAEPSNINTWSSFQRLKQSFRKSNKGLNSVSYSSQLLWNKLPIEIKRSGSTNSFKHSVKNYHLRKVEHAGLLISS